MSRVTELAYILCPDTRTDICPENSTNLETKQQYNTLHELANFTTTSDYEMANFNLLMNAASYEYAPDFQIEFGSTTETLPDFDGEWEEDSDQQKKSNRKKPSVKKSGAALHYERNKGESIVT